MTMKIGMIALGVVVIVWLGITSAQVGLAASQAVGNVLGGP